MVIKCYKCGAKNVVKNGKVFGWQRYKCKECGYQFTKTAPSGKPLHIKLLAHNLYAAGMSMRQIADIIGVTAQSVSRWIKKWHIAYQTEIGNTEIKHIEGEKKSLDILNIDNSSSLFLLSNSLPSKAKVHIIVELPKQP